MIPRNELSRIPEEDVQSYIVTSSLARFTIDLLKYPELRSQAVVKRCMDEFIAFYPDAAQYAALLKGNWLTIDVYGAINPKYFGK